MPPYLDYIATPVEDQLRHFLTTHPVPRCLLALEPNHVFRFSGAYSNELNLFCRFALAKRILSMPIYCLCAKISSEPITISPIVFLSCCGCVNTADLLLSWLSHGWQL